MNFNHTKGQNFTKKLLEDKEMDFRNGVINIQTAGYNGAFRVSTFADMAHRY